MKKLLASLLIAAQALWAPLALAADDAPVSMYAHATNFGAGATADDVPTSAYVHITNFTGAITPSTPILSGYTAGSVLFVGSAGQIAQDNSNFFWDATNHRLGIRNIVPTAMLSIGTSTATAQTFNTFTDASNYENAYMGDWGVSANIATYGTGKAGTGSTRSIQFVVGGAQALSFNTSASATFTKDATLNSSNSGLSINDASISSVGGALRIQSNAAADKWGLGLGDAGGTHGSDLYLLRFDGSSWVNVLAFGNSNGIVGVTGLTSASPGFKKVGTTFQITLADGSALAPLQSASISTSATNFMHITTGTLASGAAAALGTLTNAPTAGNPTKWVPINDNGTTRYIPAW